MLFAAARRVALKEPVAEIRLYRIRALVLTALMGAALLGLCGRLVYLQVIEHQRYATASQNNRVKVRAVAPARGLIYDRNGVLLAENLPSHSLQVIPEQVRDLDATLAALGEVVSLRAQDIERFRALRRSKQVFESVRLRSFLTEAESAAFAVQRHRFPGVDLVGELHRHYPLGDLTAHSVGYVGRVAATDLDGLSAEARVTDHIGKSGVERAYEDRLNGTVGHEQVEVNAHGRSLRVLERQPALAGDDLQLTLDMGLQRLAVQALGERSGAVVALDPNSGEVLALASWPSFDANPFVRGIEVAEYRELLQSRQRPLFNRALRGQYPPGSTIKPFMVLAGLDAGVVVDRTRFLCRGWFKFEGQPRRYRCWRRWGHGRVDLEHAIAESCDVYFYQLSVLLGIQRMHDFLVRFMFGRPTGLDIGGELSGLMPSPAWKRANRGQPWFPGETVIAGIGQGFVLSTPLQLAAATAMLATRGQLHAPHLVMRADGGAAVQAEVELPAAHWQAVIEAMEAVVHGPTGTARKIGEGIGYRMAGKTGTSQVYGLSQDDDDADEPVAEELRDHGLFIAFAPVDQPRIAVAVVVEHGGGGSSAAAPVARRVIDYYLQRQGVVPPPERTTGGAGVETG